MQISRSEQKRRVKEVERLVAELVSLPPHVLGQAPVPEECRRQLIAAAALRGGVRQRQIKYLTKVVQQYPLAELYDLVGRHRGHALAAQKQTHTLELFRDALIEEALEHQEQCRQTGGHGDEQWPSRSLTALRAEMPEADPLVLSRLAALFARTRNPRYSREIFRYLRSVHETRQRNSRRQVTEG
jgi:ribosome-associated protein